MCSGYCKDEVAIDVAKVVFKQSGWTNAVKPTYCEAPNNTSKWDSLTAKLQINPFFRMTEEYGCPDCADGGAEWMEVLLSSGKSHKVTFENNNEPAELKTIVEALRFKLNKTPCMTIIESTTP